MPYLPSRTNHSRERCRDVSGSSQIGKDQRGIKHFVIIRCIGRTDGLSSYCALCRVYRSIRWPVLQGFRIRSAGFTSPRRICKTGEPKAVNIYRKRSNVSRISPYLPGKREALARGCEYRVDHPRTDVLSVLQSLFIKEGSPFYHTHAISRLRNSPLLSPVLSGSGGRSSKDAL